MRFRNPGQEGQRNGHKTRQDRGLILMSTVVMVSGLLFLAATAAIRANHETQLTSVELDNSRAFYAAEAAIEWGSAELSTLLANNVDPTQAQLDALTKPSLSGFTFEDYRILKVGAMTEEQISQGDYAGLRGYVQRYSVEAQANSNRRNAVVSREIQHQFIPLFQFGVFYEGDLEIFPGPLMTFAGPIHTNSNLYMGAESEIRCESSVTAVGKYWHYRKDNAHPDPPGAVKIMDQFNVWQNVWRGSYWLDNRRATWASEATAVWGGNFRDESHGLSTLRLPIPPAADQHITIERGLVSDGESERAAKYWYKATVRYINGVLTDSMGTPLNQPGVYTYTANKFWDDREDKYVDCVDINIQTMVNNNYRPPNGILYISESRGDFGAVRVINGSTLPVGGLTIVTDRPMYVKGHYNTVAKKGAALYSDALTLLSPSWNDANSAQPLSNRVPSSQTVNACILTGHVATINGGTYSGGLENNFRFLERWSTQTVTYRGSIIDLWFSVYATRPWIYGVYYTAPQRNWAYDTDLLNPANWPPGTPRVQTVQRGSWRQIS